MKAWYGTREVPWPPVSTNCQSYFEETAFTVKTMTVARATKYDNTFAGRMCRPVKIMSFFGCFEIC